MNAWLQSAAEFLSHPLMLPLVVTGLAGAIAYVAARRAAWLSRGVAVFAAAAALVLVLRLLAAGNASLDVPWLEVSGLRIAIVMSNHTFGTLIAAGGAFFGLLVAIYALAYERGQRDEGRFYAFLCWTLTGTIGAGLADDLIWLLMCWELVSLCLYMLLNLGRGESPAAAARTFGMIGLGDAAMLLAVALIGVTQGTFRIEALDVAVNTPLDTFCYLLFLAAALAKAGAIPLHNWIPAAASDASAATFALLPASLDKLLGIYLLAWFSLEVFTLNVALRAVLMILGAATILGAVLMAMVQHRLKKLLSFHAVSQVGYMVLGIGTGVPIGIAGGVFHMINHAIYKACLFLTAGVVERRTGTDELNKLGGLAPVLPLTFVCAATAALAISGVPPLNGFVSKWLVYQGCLANGSLLGVLCLIAAVFGSALTLASFFKVLAAVYWGPRAASVERTEAPLAVRIAYGLPMFALALLCIGFGVVAAWPLNHLVLPALAGIGVQVPIAGGAMQLDVGSLGLWEPGPATMLIVLGLLGGLALYVLGRTTRARVTRPFLGGELLADEKLAQFPATSYYRTIEELPGLGGALRDGQRSALDVYRLGGTYGNVLVQALRRQHTGVLSLYVTWCLIGIVAVTVYLMAVT